MHYSLAAYLFHRIIIKFVRERIVHMGTHRSWDITTKERRILEKTCREFLEEFDHEFVTI